jgi:hypothetical protein
LAIRGVIWDRLQPVSVAADYCVAAVQLVFLIGMGRKIALQFLTTQALRIETASRRHGLCVYEWLVLIRQIEAAAIDHQEAAQVSVPSGLRALKTLVQI